MLAGYYQPDYSPDGTIGATGLVAPESELSTAPAIIGFLNGMISLIETGLTNDGYGFGVTNRNNPTGQLSYEPEGDIVDELDLLLTGGRLNSQAKSIIKARVDGILDAGTSEEITEIQSCSASSDLGSGWECSDALFPYAGNGWAMNNMPSGLTEQWIEAVFAEPQNLHTMCWQNRGNFRNIHGVTLSFSDTSSEQVMGISRFMYSNPTSYPGGDTINLKGGGIGSYCDNIDGDATDPNKVNTCCQPLPTPVTATWVRITVDPNVDQMYSDYRSFKGSGASMIKFFRQAPPSVAARAQALKEAQILMLASSEFHTTSLARFKESALDPVASVQSQSRPYKAIVVMLLGQCCTHTAAPSSFDMADNAAAFCSSDIAASVTTFVTSSRAKVIVAAKSAIILAYTDAETDL